jgi:5-methyltetrahydrofolate--homocysteine methyltransferase
MMRRMAMLRQQTEREPEAACLSLADFVAPRDSGLSDHVGAFAVTAGLGVDGLVAELEAAGDDYGAIMAKALADRLAEAFAEYMHRKARIAWGYESDGPVDQEYLRSEQFRGIRPAFGYPACPDHSEKNKLFALLDAGRIGMQLTESCAMTPAASVSGIYLAHPEARYFMVGAVQRDQVQAYAALKGVSLQEVERWLAPNLGYDPDAVGRAAE